MAKKVRKDYEETKGMTHAEKIEYYTYLNDMVSINNGNGKTGRACLTISMPVELTCDHNAPCYKNKVCYCLKGNQCFANVVGAYYRNYRLWTENHQRFKDMVIYFLKYAGLKLVRWHDAGDIIDDDYFQMIIDIAKELPNIQFLCYTKKYNIVNNYLDKTSGQYPDNLCLRFSYADKNWEVDNRWNLPTAYIDFDDKSLNPEIPKNAWVCDGTADQDDWKHTCSVCKMCFNKKVKSVVFKQH